MTLTTTHKMKRQMSLKEIRMTSYEVLSDGQSVPIYEPTQQSKHLKFRKYTEALKKHTKDLHRLLEKGYRLARIEGYTLSAQPSEEEKLAKYTHRVLVMELVGEKTVNCLIPCSSRFRYKDVIKRASFYKYLSDDNGVAVVSFSCDEINSENGTSFDFSIKVAVTYVDFYTLRISKCARNIPREQKEGLEKFEVMLSRGIVCVVWTLRNMCSCYDFTGGEAEFREFKTTDDLAVAYYINMDRHYLVVSGDDQDFFESVFSTTDSSLRMTSYYSCKTGLSFNSKGAIAQVLEQDTLLYVSDTIFLDIPSNPKWMVLEWLQPDMTLSHVRIYRVTESGALEKDGVFNFQTDFADYKVYFGKLNELQSKVLISRSPWQAFLWISWSHVMIIDLHSYDIVGILHTDLTKYKDIRSERYDFELDVSRTARTVTLFVKQFSNVVYFCHFNLVPMLTLKQLSMNRVIERYSSTDIAEIKNVILGPVLKQEVLDAY